MTRIAFLLAALLVHSFSFGQAWPSKPVRILVGFPAGGSNDSIARMLAERLTKQHGQTFLVENRAGAGGNIATEALARSAPDGYTLLLSSPGPLTTAPFLQRSLPYDARKDFTAIAAVADMPILIAAGPKTPVTAIGELLEFARKNPGKLAYGSSGNGSVGHLSGELLKSLANIDLVHVPYKGSAPALQDLVGGQVELTFDNLASALRFVQNGQIKALAISAVKRWPGLENVPTLQEAGFAGYRSSTWAHLFGPARMPADVVRSLNRSVNEFVASEDGIKRLLALGFQPVGGTPEDLDRIVQADAARWGPLITKLGIKLD
jgi:tripartite-type tricarboxylate transporter receptor subunit TctC